jgi:hypothetical protein
MKRKQKLINEIFQLVWKKLTEDATVIKFDNWHIPSMDVLKREFKVEHELKRKNLWHDEKDFLNAIKEGEVETITPSEDRKIGNRSRTVSKEDIIDLIQGYASYPVFRNEDTVEAIYQGFRENKPIEMPIVIEFNNGSRRVFSGNTRMDIAFQLGINPDVIIVRPSIG